MRTIDGGARRRSRGPDGSQDREPVDPATVVARACDEGTDRDAAVPRQQPERRVVARAARVLLQPTGRTARDDRPGRPANAAAMMAWTARRSSAGSIPPISIPSGAGPGSTGPSRSICMCQKWRIGRRPRARDHGRRGGVGAVDRVAEPRRGRPASSSAARASIRSNSDEPMPRPRCSGWTTPHEPTTPGSSRLACPYATIAPASSVTTQASAARSKSGRLHTCRTKCASSVGSDAVRALVGEEHIADRIGVVRVGARNA